VIWRLAFPDDDAARQIIAFFPNEARRFPHEVQQSVGSFLSDDPRLLI